MEIANKLEKLANSFKELPFQIEREGLAEI